MNSYWKESVNKKKYPKLSQTISTDVCIIGGGMSGILTAYMLLDKGYDITIVEKNEMFMGVTANSTAKLTSQHGLFYNYLINNFSMEFAKKYLDANEEAIKLVNNIIKKENIDCDFEKQDAYVYTEVESELEKIKQEVEAVKSLEFEAEFVTKTNLPCDVLGAIKFKNQAKFHPLKYLNSILNILEERGCSLYENTKINDIKKDGNRYSVISETSNINAKYVVMATHYPIINFPGLHFLKMYQDRSYIIAVETNQKLFDGVYISNESPSFSYRTIKYGNKELLLICGSDHKTGDKAVNIESTFIDLEDKAKKLYPDAKILYKWSTEDCISLDKIPYIGSFSKLMPNIFIATGFKKWGMTSSHVAAKIISDKIQGITNEYEDIFSSTRFNPIANKEEFGNNVKQTFKSLILSRLNLPDEKFEDIENNSGGIVIYKGEKLGIFKNENSEVFAVKPYCTHLRM